MLVDGMGLGLPASWASHRGFIVSPNSATVLPDLVNSVTSGLGAHHRQLRARDKQIGGDQERARRFPRLIW